MALRADNNGEEASSPSMPCCADSSTSGFTYWRIVSLNTLLADGIITPAITVTTAIRRTQASVPTCAVIPITLAIITIIFFVQRFGTEVLANRLAYLCCYGSCCWA